MLRAKVARRRILIRRRIPPDVATTLVDTTLGQ